jgi:hypothetical protein
LNVPPRARSTLDREQENQNRNHSKRHATSEAATLLARQHGGVLNLGSLHTGIRPWACMMVGQIILVCPSCGRDILVPSSVLQEL